MRRLMRSSVSMLRSSCRRNRTFVLGGVFEDAYGPAEVCYVVGECDEVRCGVVVAFWGRPLFVGGGEGGMDGLFTFVG